MWKAGVLRRIVAAAGEPRTAVFVMGLAALALSACSRADHSPPTQNATSATQPESTITFRNTRLAEVLERFNRYQRNPIRVEDPQIAGLAISGVLDPHDPEGLLEVLKTYHNIQAKTLADGSVMLFRSKR